MTSSVGAHAHLLESTALRPGNLGAPRLLAMVDRLLARAVREIQVLAALTPLDVRHERARLVAEVRAGRPARPRWSYAAASHEALRRALDAAEEAVARVLGHAPLAQVYLERVRELSLEAALSEAAGSSAVGALARLRYEPRDPRAEAAAARLAVDWISGPADPAPREAAVLSDSPHPASLLSRMRAAVGSRRLPFAVVAHRSLASLAATGDRAVLVASGRLVHEEDAVRTVLHEVEGHALPRARAMAEGRPSIFRAGTARGVDDQEGRALLLEQRAGLLGPRRRRQLAARHLAVEGMLAGGHFADVAFALVRSHGLEAEEAVVVAERAFRGADGASAGLGRERVYLEAYVRVGEHLAEHPEDEALLALGQVSVEAAPKLRALV